MQKNNTKVFVHGSLFAITDAFYKYIPIQSRFKFKSFFLTLSFLTFVFSLAAQIAVAPSCPAGTADLTTISADNLPAGTTLTWHSGIPVSDANKEADVSSIATGTVLYAAFYDPVIMCYSDSVTQVSVGFCAESICPDTVVDLTLEFTATNLPSGNIMTWHTALPATTANKMSDSTSAAAGTYYAVFYDASNDCYSDDGNAAALVVVTKTDCDTDGDGVPDTDDLDSDNDGIPDDVEILTAGTGGDTDGDGIPDYLDLDSDNDGIPDLIEAGGTDTDGDGLVDDACNVPATCDVDGDGLMDSADAVDDSANPNPTAGLAGTTLPITDTDSDGNPDFQDLDSDNDGINDITEAGIPDTDNDGIVDNINPNGTLINDADSDGFDDGLDPNDNNTAGTGDGSGTPVTPADTDEDGFPDFQDLDSDNDGINDIVESGNAAADADGDGIADNPTTDTDGDGIPDSIDDAPADFGDAGGSEPTDTDNDNIPDHQDLDSDDDGVLDIVESGNAAADPNGDGVADGGDADGDGIPDLLDDDPANFGDAGDAGNTDDTSDPLDANSGGTGVLVDSGTDADGDGIPDSADDDDVNFGTSPDTDGDGVPDTDDLDSDNDGIPDDVEILTAGTGGDTDGDGIPDYLDLDSDNDGIPDLIEAGGTDTDGDGLVDDACNVPATCDVDGDGLMDSADAVDDSANPNPTAGLAGTTLPITDTDSDGNPDFQDLDSDNDGINDITEAGIPDTDNDGIVDNINPNGTLINDADSDGFDDGLDPNDNNTAGTGDGSGTPVTPADTDEDGFPDFQDLDSDNDGINDIVESGNAAADADGDGIADNPTTDTDGDGIPDSIDDAPADFGDAGGSEPTDTDNDNIPDHQDLDSDDDGVLDIVESGNAAADPNGDGVADGGDADGDGIPDLLDDDPANFGDAGDAGNTDDTSDPLDANSGGTGVLVDSGTDADGDGIPDSADEDDFNFGSSLNTTFATSDFVNTSVDAQVTTSVLVNDEDQNGDTQSIYSIKVDTNGDGQADANQMVGSPTTVAGVDTDGTPNLNAGTLTMNSDGSYTFVPSAGFAGEVNFAYTVCDSKTVPACDSANVEIGVLPLPNTSETNLNANLDALTTEEGATFQSNLIANDSDPDGGDLSISSAQVDTDGDGIVDAPLTLGSATVVAGIDKDGNIVPNAGTIKILANGEIEVIPAGGFQGTIIAEYTATDDDLDADSASIIIEVMDASENELFAGDDSKTSDLEAEISGNLFDNDFDPEGDSFVLTDIVVDTDGDGLGDTSKAADIDGTTSISVGGIDVDGNTVANAGTLVIDSDGTYDFVSNANFAGNINICYTVCDGQSPAACDNATLEITVLEVFRDYGDGPSNYPVCWHRAMTDSNTDDVFDGTNDVWLGSKSSFEGSSKTSPTGDADSFDDALTFGNDPGNFPIAIAPNTSFNVDFTVNSTSPNLVFYGLWIDWNEDGTYDDFYNGSQVTASPATASVLINSPANYAGQPVNVRIRVDDSALDSDDYQGGKTNGEVEDYTRLVVLPVSLKSFTSQKDDCNILLNWSTASEENFSHYEVQWSGDGINFTTLDYVIGENSPTGSFYTFSDEYPSDFNYYRLKMVDVDASFEYSPVVYNDVDCAGVKDFKIYPNPMFKEQNILYIDLYSPNDFAEINIVDMLGRTVKRVSLEVNRNIKNKVHLDLSELPSGTYLVQQVGKRKTELLILTE